MFNHATDTPKRGATPKPCVRALSPPPCLPLRGVARHARRRVARERLGVVAYGALVLLPGLEREAYPVTREVPRVRARCPVGRRAILERHLSRTQRCVGLGRHHFERALPRTR